MKLSSLVSMLPMVIITGCSSAPALPDTWKLGTTSKSQNYYYCESCLEPTKLTNQVYQPLEPDEPITTVKPVIEPTPAININNTSKRRHKVRKHKHKRKNSQVQNKQCIKRRN